MDSPATVVVMMLLLMVTISQLPGTSHCMVMSKSSNVSNWCDGRFGRCQLIPQEGLDLLEPDDSFRHLVELDTSNVQQTQPISFGTLTPQCGRTRLPPCATTRPDVRLENCGTYNKGCYRHPQI
ncbi:hypothetical protein ACFX13_046079 [Malus domestica]